MGTKEASTKFGGWLQKELTSRDLGVRGLARAMVKENGQSQYERHQEVERVRRNLNRYLWTGTRPSEANRNEIADALGVSRDQVPSDDDEEDHLRPTLDQFLREQIAVGVAEALAKAGVVTA